MDHIDWNENELETSTQVTQTSPRHETSSQGENHQTEEPKPKRTKLDETQSDVTSKSQSVSSCELQLSNSSILEISSQSYNFSNCTNPPQALEVTQLTNSQSQDFQSSPPEPLQESLALDTSVPHATEVFNQSSESQLSSNGSSFPPSFPFQPPEVDASSQSPNLSPPKPLCQNLDGRESAEDSFVADGLSDEDGLNGILSSVSLEDVKKLSDETKNKLSFLLGSCAHDKLRTLANENKLRSSRELTKISLSETKILCNLSSDLVHSFFEGCTQKFPRSNENEDVNATQLHTLAFESLLKVINPKTIGVGAVKKNLEIACSSSSAALSSFNPGGGIKVIKKLPLGNKLSNRKGSGLLVGDNAQRGINKIQRHSRLKMKREEANVKVVLHLVKYENEDDEKSELFKAEEISPAFNNWHPLFRPVSVDFLSIFKKRIKIAEEIGHKVISVILNNFLMEVFEDVKSGNGESSMSKLSRFSQMNTGNFPKICVKCHNHQEYNPSSPNICEQCHNNPTTYQTSEPNPYLRFGLDQGDFKPVKSMEQEPLDLNPSSYVKVINVQLLD